MTITVGKHSYGIDNIHIHPFNPETNLTIGSFCSIADNLHIFFGGNHRTDWVTTFPFGHMYKNVFTTFNGVGHPASKGDITIGNDVWIGYGVTILSGVRIGDGAVIAANSTITKDVEPYSIVGGNPAKFIRHRFTQEQINSLLQIQWWNWDDTKINEYAPLLCQPNIDLFIEKAKQGLMTSQDE